MKKAINVILGLCALVLLYLCYESIMAPIHFNEEKEIRENAVKARLLQIRNAEDLYRQQHEGEFCDSFSVLINFIKTARIPHVNKVGELSDEQLEKGLTDAKAAAIVASGDAAAIAARAEEYGVPLEGRMFAASVIDAPSQPLSTVAVEEIIDEATKEDRSIIPFQYENQIVMIFSSDMQDSFSPLFAKQIYRSLSLLQSRIIHYFSRSFNMGIGEIVHEPTSLPESYRSALEALNYTQIYPDQHIISIGDVETIENDHIDSAGELRSELVLAIKFGNSEDTEKAIHAFFQGIAETPNVQNTVINILSIISEICSSYGRNIATLLEDEDLFMALSHANTISRAGKLLAELAVRTNGMASGARANSHIQFIENAKRIIKERYADPVFGLEQLADEISVSPAYFSTTFKKETGTSFVQYLTNVRLEKAKEMLKNSDAKTYEIAEKTGFSEPNYFSFTFRKNVGLSPSQYRSQHRA